MTARENFVMEADITLMSAVDKISFRIANNEEKKYGKNVAECVKRDTVGAMTLAVWKVRNDELNITYWMDEEIQKVELNKALDIIKDICDNYVALANHREESA